MLNLFNFNSLSLLTFSVACTFFLSINLSICLSVYVSRKLFVFRSIHHFQSTPNCFMALRSVIICFYDDSLNVQMPFHDFMTLMQIGEGHLRPFSFCRKLKLGSRKFYVLLAKNFKFKFYYFQLQV